MKKFVLTIDSAGEITQYIKESWLTKAELDIASELLKVVTDGDQDRIAWFRMLGPSIRHIIMNTHSYRHGLDFGFDSLKLGKYGWLESPEFLDVERFEFGRIKDSCHHSYIRIGRGVNGIWAYGISYCFGSAGGVSPLSVFNTKFPSREAVIDASIKELKNMMMERVGDPDTGNFNPKLIKCTLRDIDTYMCNSIQLSLF